MEKSGFKLESLKKTTSKSFSFCHQSFSLRKNNNVSDSFSSGSFTYTQSTSNLNELSKDAHTEQPEQPEFVRFRTTSLESGLHYGLSASKGHTNKMEDKWDASPFKKPQVLDRPPSPKTSTRKEEISEGEGSAQPPLKKQRLSREDNMDSPNVPRHAFFGLYDGHGGEKVSDFLSKNLHQTIVDNPKFVTNTKKALQEAFELTEKNLEEMLGKNAGVGSTACVAVIMDGILYVANVGDSAAVLCRDHKAVTLTQPHSLRNPEERDRISKLGGVIHVSHRSTMPWQLPVA